MRKPFERVGIEWEGWHGFRRGLATNLERIGVRESVAAMVLRHTNDRVTRKHYIKPPSIEAAMAMRQLAETLARTHLLPSCSPEALPEGAEMPVSCAVQ
jgi:integrase